MTTPERQLKPMHFPMRIPANWIITAPEYGRLQAGHTPLDFDDRWLVHSEEGTTHLHRSWTGKEVYSFTPDERDSNYVIDEFRFVRVPGQLWLPREQQEIVRNSLLTTLGIALDVHPQPVDAAA